MKKIVVFAGSNSKESINKQLAIYASTVLKNAAIVVLDLNDFPLPIYGIDEEAKNGIPNNAVLFLERIHDADGIILSLAEHNGNFSAVFKNLYDWISRIEKKLWNHIPMLLMATSPGARGGVSVLTIAKNGFPHMGGNIVSDFLLPSFYEHYKDGQIVDELLKTKLEQAIETFENSWS